MTTNWKKADTEISTPSSTTISQIASAINKAKAERAGFVTAAEIFGDRVRDLTEEMDALDQAGKQIRDLALACQASCAHSISNIVTRCLDAVFSCDGKENRYTFDIEFIEKRGQTEANCTLRDADGNTYYPLVSTGGGVLDIVAFGLRLACMMLQRPRPANILIMDEPFRYLSKTYREPLMQLLETLAIETGTQFIMVTHFSEFQRGNVIELGG